MYWSDYFENLKRDELRSMNRDILTRHKDIKKLLRARFVDWIFHVWTSLQSEDESVPFQAVTLMDRYLANEKNPIKENDLQLVGVSALFIVSKTYEIYPICLEQIENDMCFKKYT